jgi:polyadenylation factor subunit 2
MTSGLSFENLVHVDSPVRIFEEPKVLNYTSLLRISSSKKILDYYSSVVTSLSKDIFYGSDIHSILPRPIPLDNLELLAPMFYKSFPASSISSKLAYSRLINTRSQITCVTYSYDGGRLYASNNKGEIHEWLVNKGFPHPLEKLESRIVTTDSKSIRCLRFMRDRSYFLTGDEEGNIVIYRSNIEKMLAVKAHVSEGYTTNTYTVTSVAPSPTDFMFSSASEDTTVKIWDIGEISHRRNNQKAIRNYSGHNGAVMTVDWNPIKGLIASGSKDTTIRFWDPRSKNCIGIIYEHNSGVNSLEFNSNSNWLLSTSEDQSCRVFDIRANKEIQRFTGHNASVICAIWHPLHEDMFASGSKDGKLAYWIVGYNKPQAERLQKYESNIIAMAWHPIGNMLTTGSSIL